MFDYINLFLECTISGCLTCQNAINCAVCKGNHILTNGQCSCATATYDDGINCIGKIYKKDEYLTYLKACSTNCNQCSKTACLTCDANYYLYKGNCFNSCPTGTYSSGSNCFGQLLSRFVYLVFFVDCTANCDKCDSTTCQTCSSGYLLYSNDGKCYTSSTCPTGTYADSTNCLSMVYKDSFI